MPSPHGDGSPHAAPATAASLRAEESERKIPEGTPARRAELSREPRRWHVLRPSAGVATLRARVHVTELAGPRDRARAQGPRDARGATRPGPGRQPEAGSCCLQGQSERPRLKEREQTPRAGAAAPRAILPAVARAPRRLTPSRAGEYRNTLWGRERPQPRNCYRHGLLKLFQFMMRYCCSSLTAPTLHVQRHPRNIHVRENTVLVAFDAAHGSRNPLGVLKHVPPPAPRR